MRTTFLRVRLALTTETHLVCIACGRFRTELAIVVSAGNQESHAGIHRKCIKDVKAKRGEA